MNFQNKVLKKIKIAEPIKKARVPNMKTLADKSRLSISGKTVSPSIFEDESNLHFKDPEFIGFHQFERRKFLLYREKGKTFTSSYLASICTNLGFSSLVRARFSCDIDDFQISKLVSFTSSKNGLYAAFVTNSKAFRKSAVCFFPYQYIDDQLNSAIIVDEQLRKGLKKLLTLK